MASVPFQGLLQGRSKAVQLAHGPTGRTVPAKVGESSLPEGQKPAHAVQRRQLEDAPESDPERARDSPLDPLFCLMAVPQGAPFVPQASAPAIVPAALPVPDEVQLMISGLARRVAWGGDRRKGSARIELSQGALAGATLVVHTDQRSVQVELELPAGASARDWQERILERLEARGFSARVRVD